LTRKSLGSRLRGNDGDRVALDTVPKGRSLMGTTVNVLNPGHGVPAACSSEPRHPRAGGDPVSFAGVCMVHVLGRKIARFPPARERRHAFALVAPAMARA